VGDFAHQIDDEKAAVKEEVSFQELIFYIYIYSLLILLELSCINIHLLNIIWTRGESLWEISIRLMMGKHMLKKRSVCRNSTTSNIYELNFFFPLGYYFFFFLFLFFNE